MSHLRLLLCCLAAIAWASPARGQDVCAAVNGATIIAQDSQNTFLGRVVNSYDRESIFNEFGNYGSEFSRTSIWNQFGTFGSEFNKLSPFNEFTNTPPMIIKSGKVIGYLSANQNLRGAVAPNLLKALCEDAL